MSECKKAEAERRLWEELPNGWASAVDPKSTRTYYHNCATGKSQWECPQAVASLSRGEKLLQCAREIAAVLPDRQLRDEGEAREWDEKLVAVEKRFGEEFMKVVVQTAATVAARPSSTSEEIPEALRGTEALADVVRKAQACGFIDGAHVARHAPRVGPQGAPVGAPADAEGEESQVDEVGSAEARAELESGPVAFRDPPPPPPLPATSPRQPTGPPPALPDPAVWRDLIQVPRDAESLTCQLITLTEQLHEAVTERDAHKNLVSKQEQDILWLKIIVSKLLEPLSGEVDVELALVQRDLSKVTLDAEPLISQLDALREQLHDAVTERDAHKNVISKQEQDILSLKADWDAEQRSLTSQLYMLREQLHEAVAECEAHNNLVSKHEQDILSPEKGWDSNEQSLTSQLDSLREQLHDAVTDCDAHKNLVSKQGQDILSLKADWDAEQQSLTSQLYTLREQLHEAVTERDAHKNLVSKQEQDILSLKADWDAEQQSRTSQLYTLREQLHEAVTARETHKDLVSKQEQDILSLKKGWDSKEQSQTSQLDALREQLREAVTDCDAHKNLVSKQEQDMLSLKAEWDAEQQSRTSQLDALRVQLHVAMTEFGEIKNLQADIRSSPQPPLEEEGCLSSSLPPLDRPTSASARSGYSRQKAAQTSPLQARAMRPRSGVSMPKAARTFALR